MPVVERAGQTHKSNSLPFSEMYPEVRLITLLNFSGLFPYRSTMVTLPPSDDGAQPEELASSF